MQDFIRGTELLLLYFIIMAGTAILCRLFITIPDELFRKILHCILLFSLPVFVYGYGRWQTAALAALGFAVVVYPILVMLEKLRGFSRVTTERKKGELKHSLLLVFGMFALVITVCWGILGKRWLVLASVYAWGFGDAAAALVGKRWGRHKIHWKHTDGKKSAEGSNAMFFCSFFSTLIILGIWSGARPLVVAVTAFITATASTFAELYSKSGNDTVICPLSAMCALILCLYPLGGLA